MKRILTLLIAVSAFATLHAQSREQTRDVILGGNNGRYPGSPSYPNNGYPAYPNNGNYGSRQAQIDQVNRDYYVRVQSITNDPYMSRKDKKRAIKELEKDRKYRIEQINRNYHEDYDHHDNGKHKGWYKNNHHDRD